MKLLLDTNIVIDVLARRDPWHKDAALLLSRIERGDATGFVAAHGVTTAHYLLGKWHDRTTASTILLDLTRIVRIAAVDEDTIMRAFALGWNDLEDAVQAVCAQAVNADYLVTRNPRDFQGLPVPLASAGELLARLQ